MDGSLFHCWDPLTFTIRLEMSSSFIIIKWLQPTESLKIRLLSDEKEEAEAEYPKVSSNKNNIRRCFSFFFFLFLLLLLLFASLGFFSDVRILFPSAFSLTTNVLRRPNRPHLTWKKRKRSLFSFSQCASNISSSSPLSRSPRQRFFIRHLKIFSNN